MKKTLLTLSLLAVVGSAFGQSRAVKSALSEAKKEKPNFNEAQSLIKGAMENAETKDEAKTWYVAGFIDGRVFEIERNKQIIGQKPDDKKMYTALYDSYQDFLKCVELDMVPDKKGRVRPDYVKDIRKSLIANQNYFINGGAFFFDNKDFENAYKFFTVYSDISKLDFMLDDKDYAAVAAADTNAIKYEYYAALATTQMEDANELAIKTLTNLKDKGYNENEVYQYLSFKYQEMKDTANLINIYEEGAEKFVKEPFFIQNLINLYIYTNRTDDAIAYLDKALVNDPTNAQYWNVKGGLYEGMSKMDDAVASFEKAIEIDGEYADALGNLGRVYYNEALRLNDEASILNDKEYQAKKNNEVLPMFKKSLPYFEKAHTLVPDESQYMVALKSIYYNLNDEANLKKIEAELGY